MCGRYVVTKPVAKTRDLVTSVNVVGYVDNYNAPHTKAFGY